MNCFSKHNFQKCSFLVILILSRFTISDLNQCANLTRSNIKSIINDFYENISGSVWNIDYAGIPFYAGIRV